VTQPSLKQIEIICCGNRMIPLYENEEDDDPKDELIIRSNCSICGSSYLSSIARKLDADADSVFRFEPASEIEKYLQIIERRGITLEKNLEDVIAYLIAIRRETKGLRGRLSKKSKKRRSSK
jgi:hypothetical protein